MKVDRSGISAQGAVEAVVQKQERAESFREPQTALEIRVVKGQEWRFSLKHSMRSEGSICE